MTNDEVGRAYQQLLTSEPDVLEEGSAFAFAEADAPRRREAQSWLALSQSLWVDAQGARGDNLVRVRAQRQQALAVAYLLAKGADPAQIPSLAAPAVPAAAPQTLVDNLVVAMRKALPLLPGEIALQVQELLSPGSIAVMGGAFAGWAVAHAFGVGAVADLLVGALGLAFLGWDALRGAKLLYGFVNHCMPPAGATALDSAAQEFAELITLLGVDVVSMILLGRAFQKARVKLKEKPKASEPLSAGAKQAQDQRAQGRCAQSQRGQSQRAQG